MKLLGTILTVVGMMAFTQVVSAMPVYRTQRIARVARELHLVLPESAGVDTRMDSVMSYKGHPIHVCINAFGEVEHVGYRIFSQEVRESFREYPVLDFLERYLLEQDLNIKDPGFYSRSNLVRCNKGNLSMLLRDLKDVEISVDFVSRRYYWFSCKRGNEVLEVEVPADAQLLLATNSKEQEEIFERELYYVKASATFPDYTNEWKAKVDVENTDPIYVVNEGTYLSKEIRSDLYLTQKGGVHTLLCDTLQPVKSIANMMLTGASAQDVPVQLTVDKYGNVRTTYTISLSKLISLLKSEGCQPYIGVKGKKDNKLTCTLFLFNEELAYDHVFTLQVPYSVLTGGTDPVTAICYLYVPLQNVTEGFFNQQTKD